MFKNWVCHFSTFIPPSPSWPQIKYIHTGVKKKFAQAISPIFIKLYLNKWQQFQSKLDVTGSSQTEICQTGGVEASYPACLLECRCPTLSSAWSHIKCFKYELWFIVFMQYEQYFLGQLAPIKNVNASNIKAVFNMKLLVWVLLTVQGWNTVLFHILNICEDNQCDTCIHILC